MGFRRLPIISPHQDKKDLYKLKECKKSKIFHTLTEIVFSLIHSKHRLADEIECFPSPREALGILFAYGVG